jgi:hypothetical protein
MPSHQFISNQPREPEPASHESTSLLASQQQLAYYNSSSLPIRHSMRMERQQRRWDDVVNERLNGNCDCSSLAKSTATAPNKQVFDEIPAPSRSIKASDSDSMAYRRKQEKHCPIEKEEQITANNAKDEKKHSLWPPSPVAAVTMDGIGSNVASKDRGGDGRYPLFFPSSDRSKSQFHTADHQQLQQLSVGEACGDGIFWDWWSADDAGLQKRWRQQQLVAGEEYSGVDVGRPWIKVNGPSLS